MYLIILHYATQSIRRFFEKNRTAKVVTLLGFFAAFAFLVTVVYFGFRTGFRHIAKDIFFGDALFLYIVELFLLVSFVLVVASALISGMATLFRGEGDTLLLASPRHTTKPLLVFSRMFLSSLWPFLAVILPALFAVTHVYGLALFGFLLALFSVVLLIALGVVAAMALLLVVAWFLYFVGGRNASFATPQNLTALVALLFLGKLAFVWERVTTIDLVRFFQARSVDVTVPDLSPIIDQFHILPTHFSAMTIYLARTGDVTTALFYALYFFLFLSISAYGLFLLGRHHLVLWELFQEHTSGSRQFFSVPAFGASLLRRAKTGGEAIFGKEVVAFLRNSRGLLWFGFITLIWLMQTGAGKIVSRGLGAERVTADVLPAFVGVFQFAVIMYFVSMFVLRFAFPSFSSERRTAWLIAAAPVDLGTVFTSKLRFFVTLFSLLAVFFALINILTTPLPLSLVVTLLLTLVLATLFLTTYGLSLGAIFPNFESDDPEVLSTTMPGLGFIFGALSYGALGAYALGEMLRDGNSPPLFLFSALSLVATVYLTRLARRRLVSMEF
ncbi:MAG: hypothetical protein A3C93_05045 [Candidatus Lloydbacteria bacterium RIFCSPHIGHO2_02_FULL_54_17]|uniref:Uncharacterized protein n=1 Tax=Candidatus Lloydbacteria bacterium RIFCSPHIGHO2_02_FULL_54_17 TaxID=1798664 RepID=A0A1G2DBB6_9BACT|nr:MAG: hypothetical protein A2762_06150 [Candidatus Lloydbacteria bacterium RIFCSPHIGHO2_01_FULL_54_11]OGZ10833.1 MAG: hypothetical protein A3C93_05045 [Candidatus Lloydbacteria bacterium RIFCSPHIGHO2_02_FULL_54_17]OGZ13268.1 MAG: hypothetical protein A2948_02990 [Candidatus Lloydbacteria bacterium RIFCSPLOWO2_01_FULL_54_18]OGZ14378.1 MAG: hypothetical protein A3H76_04860 [Candidatus Lloydbacteria bacterium RIFCSPLOWO2_02_FULL_54_12]